MKTVIAIDYSGSTGRSLEYWQYVNGVVNETKGEQTTYVLWDDESKLKTYEDVNDQICSMKGHGCTDPSSFIKFLKSGDRLEIVTDGEVPQNTVTACDKMLTDIILESVTIHVVKIERIGCGFGFEPRSLNLSVAAPFVRSAKQYQIVTKTPGENASILTKGEPLNLSKYKNNPELFLQNADEILQKITIENLGRNNHSARNEILDIRKQLLLNLQHKKTNEQLDSMTNLKRSLERDMYGMAMKEAKKVSCSSVTEKEIETIIQQMIVKCDGIGEFTFCHHSNRLYRAVEIDEKSLIDTTEMNTDEVPAHFECPIYFDKDVPVLLIRAGAPVLESIDKKYEDMLINNPLLFLNNPDLTKSLTERLDCVIGLKAALKLFGTTGTVKSPMTQRPISCFVTTIPLSYIKEETHQDALKYSLANLFFGKKLAGIGELWLAVLYFVVEKIKYLENDFALYLQDTMVNKLKHRYSTMSMSSLITPTIRCTLDVSIWYCCVSAHIYEGGVENRLQHFVTSHHLRLLDIFGYPYDKKWTAHRLIIYHAFHTMMKMKKRDHKDFNILIKALVYQNSVTLPDGTIILLDGKKQTSFETNPFKDLSVSEIFYLSTLVDTSKTVGKITIPTVFPEIIIPEAVINYGYPLYVPEDKLSEYQTTKICSKTMRPYTHDQSTSLHWEVQSTNMYGPLEKQISLYNYFIVFVEENKKYPQENEFIKWVAVKQNNREISINTLPVYIEYFVKLVMEEFKNIMKTVSVSDFNKIAFKSRFKDIRLQMEKEV